MGGSEVALAALGIMATIVGVLVWLLKKLFTQNESTIKENSKSNSLLATSITRLANASEEQVRAARTRDEEHRSFQAHVVEKLDLIEVGVDRTHKALVNKSTKRR